MKLSFLYYAILLAALSAYAQPQGVSMRSTNGHAYGTLQIHGPVIMPDRWNAVGATNLPGAVNPVDYGADATGVTNSTTAFQAAINTGRRVKVPKGSFLLTSLSMTNGSILEGMGDQTRLTFTASPAISYNTNSSNFADTNSPAGYGKFTVQNLAMIGYDTNVGINFSSCHKAVGSHLTVSGFQLGVGFISAPNRGVYYSALMHTLISQCTTSIVFSADGVQAANANTIFDVKSHNANCGIYLGASCYGNTIESYGSEFMAGDDAKGVVVLGANNTLMDVWCESQVPTGKTWTGLHLLNGFNTVIGGRFPAIAGGEGTWHGLLDSYPYNTIINSEGAESGTPVYINKYPWLGVGGDGTTTGDEVATFHGNAGVDTNFTVRGSLTVSSNTAIGGNLTVLGTSNNINNVTITNGGMHVPGPLATPSFNATTVYATNLVDGDGYGFASTNWFRTNNNTFNGSNTFSGNLYLAATPKLATNLWALDTAFPVKTNRLVLASGAATGGITGVANSPTTGVAYGELLVIASGDITFTNATGIYTSDFADSRVITNGNTAIIAVDVVAGRSTNLAIVQFSKR